MKYVIGLDIGGTKIEGVLVNERYKILEDHRVPTKAKCDKKEVVQNIARVIDGLSGRKITGVGISIAGITNKQGKIVFEPNIPSLLGVGLHNELQHEFKLPIMVENDANCFALAEHRFGAGKGTDNMIGLIWGTGIGGGIIVNGKLYHGTTGRAGEFGHTIIDASGPKGHCGHRGCFETWCAGPQVVKRYKQAGGKLRNPTISDIYLSRERVAKKHISIMLEKLGIGLANIAAVFNPQMIVLGGGVSNVSFYPEIRAAFREQGHAELIKNVRIVKNKLGDSAGKLGAASLVLRKG